MPIVVLKRLYCFVRAVDEKKKIITFTHPLRLARVSLLNPNNYRPKNKRRPEITGRKDLDGPVPRDQSSRVQRKSYNYYIVEKRKHYARTRKRVLPSGLHTITLASRTLGLAVIGQLLFTYVVHTLILINISCTLA